MKNFILILNKLFLNIIFILAGFLFSNCRGDKSSEPPIHPIRNMVQQSTYGPQSKNEFFKDSRAARPPVKGTIAEGESKTNKELYYGIEPNSTLEHPVWVKQFPVTLTNDFLKKRPRALQYLLCPLSWLFRA